MDMRKLWIGLIVLAILTPVGLILPEVIDSEEAWGEWGAEELVEMVGFIPHGLETLDEMWDAPLPDYAFKGQEDAPLHSLSLSYVVSAIVGIGVSVGVVLLLSKVLIRGDRAENT